MKEAVLYEQLPKGAVRCNICQVRCVIQEGKRGVCRTRWNKDGRLYTLIYGVTSSVCVDPVEKKPLYHFFPGTAILSAGTRGCNFACPGCQNWQISHDSPLLEETLDFTNIEHLDLQTAINMERMTPAESVAYAQAYGCQGICWTYNDPSIWFEHTYEAARLAKKAGLYTAYITNGYSTPEALDVIGPYLDAFRVDIKGFSKESYYKVSKRARFEGILEVTKRAKYKWGMHVECVTNVTPTINDSAEMLRGIAGWIRTELGEFTPWHVTRFYPYLDLSHLPPTPISTLERTYEIGREEGLKYVYMGNVPGHPFEDTYCHRCGTLVIRRRGFAIAQVDLKPGGYCAQCGTWIPGVWGQREIRRTSGERFSVLHA